MIKNIPINNLLLTQNALGISITHAARITIGYTHIIYNFNLQTFYGILLSNSIDGSINSCKINLNSSPNDIFGIYLSDTMGIFIQDTQANFNKSTLLGSSVGITITGTHATSTSGSK